MPIRRRGTSDQEAVMTHRPNTSGAVAIDVVLFGPRHALNKCG